MQNSTRSLLLCAVSAWALYAGAAGAQEPIVKVVPARHEARLGLSMLLDAKRAGKRIVAVGERGHILLSDDGGATFRQATTVPVDFTLTSVAFADDKNGWAVGHGGTILHTRDGGEHWDLQHQDLAVDQPLFSVHFRDANTGWASGLWSLLLATTDGGKTWTKTRLTPAEGQQRADLNLLRIFEGQNGKLLMAAEQGLVLTSDDGGKSWRYSKTGSAASLWSGATGRNGVSVVGGLRGRILRTVDAGATWMEIPSPVAVSITQIVSTKDAWWASTVNGAVLRSVDDGLTWVVAKQYGTSVVALLPLDGQTVLAFSKRGLLGEHRSKGSTSVD